MEVPVGVASKLCVLANAVPVTACGLLQHESKVSVLHFSVKKHEAYDAPIKSREELIFHVGLRQFIGRPIFSSEFINTDKNKMERFLHAGRFSIASIYAPISFPPLPLIVLKRAGEGAAPAVAAVVCYEFKKKNRTQWIQMKCMILRLKVAAEAGDIYLLYAQIQESPHVLDHIDKIPFVDTALHIAASAGHTSFATEIYRLKPSFVWKLNRHGFSPIHLALINEHKRMVLRFVDMNKDLVRVKGKEGHV